ncbi:FMN-linked oxidoreductase [Fistulina hepatica ATCC 64428]|uniref:FMN-linked oxidoreductase n=1 Tax=Fistulina hepatica ATCC 64428 TaxID=1128425 RepID=A0A0D7ABT3_9AGAR|nr:FMN-linked oxidoreductase [Fistulina hepatica ATCC 64428]
MEEDKSALVFRPLVFPVSGVRIENALVKPALYEHLAALWGGLPNDHHDRVYSQWSAGGWGMILTGNVQVSPDHLSLGRDVIVPAHRDAVSMDRFRQWSSVMRKNNALAIVQLSHGGRQATNITSGRLPFARPLAPSPCRVGENMHGLVYWFHLLLFQRPRAMTHRDIDVVVSRFVEGAVLAHETGFNGLQLHCAHGYLLSEFLSSKTNKRDDEYSCTSPESALLIVKRIIDDIRAKLPRSFIVGVKLGAGVYGGLVDDGELAAFQQRIRLILFADLAPVEERSLAYIKIISSWRTVDFIEISGGDYESPDFMAHTVGGRGGASFQRVSRAASRMLKATMPEDVRPLFILTGGIKTPAMIHDILQSGDADLCGIGRLSILHPDLPLLLQKQNLAALPDNSVPDFKAAQWWKQLLPRIKLVGASMEVAWYTVQMRAFGQLPVKNIGPVEAVFWVSAWSCADDFDKLWEWGRSRFLWLWAAGIVCCLYYVYL